MKKLINIIRKQLRPMRSCWEFFRGEVAIAKSEKRFISEFKQNRHCLPGELIVSLTSYGPRFPTLIYTLKCLISQSIRPDKIILWIAEGDRQSVPTEVKNLNCSFLEIRTTEDIKVFKKIIPTLREFPLAFIVTADDDCYYEPNWLETLLNEYEGNNREVICHKAYRILLDHTGRPLPYNEWIWNVKGPQKDPLLFSVGIGGRLYPPGSLLIPECFDQKSFLEMGSEDIWLFWMQRLAGSITKRTSHTRQEIVWPNSQIVSMSVDNTGKFTGFSKYDEKLHYMINRYGFIAD